MYGGSAAAGLASQQLPASSMAMQMMRMVAALDVEAIRGRRLGSGRRELLGCNSSGVIQGWFLAFARNCCWTLAIEAGQNHLRPLHLSGSAGDHETLDLDHPRLAKAMDAAKGLILNHS